MLGSARDAFALSPSLEEPLCRFKSARPPLQVLIVFKEISMSLAVRRQSAHFSHPPVATHHELAPGHAPLIFDLEKCYALTPFSCVVHIKKMDLSNRLKTVSIRACQVFPDPLPVR